MHRQGYIVEEIADYSNMAESFNQVPVAPNEKSRQGRYLLAHREEVLQELTGKIKTGTFTVKDYRRGKSWRVEKCDVSRYSP